MIVRIFCTIVQEEVQGPFLRVRQAFRGEWECLKLGDHEEPDFEPGGEGRPAAFGPIHGKFL